MTDMFSNFSTVLEGIKKEIGTNNDFRSFRNILNIQIIYRSEVSKTSQNLSKNTQLVSFWDA